MVHLGAEIQYVYSEYRYIIILYLMTAFTGNNFIYVKQGRIQDFLGEGASQV